MSFYERGKESYSIGVCRFSSVPRSLVGDYQHFEAHVLLPAGEKISSRKKDSSKKIMYGINENKFKIIPVTQTYNKNALKMLDGWCLGMSLGNTSLLCRCL
jgi:hypothetical protein